MILILLCAVLLVALAVSLALRTLGLRQLEGAERVGRIAAYGFSAERDEGAEPATFRSRLDSFATSIGTFLDRRLDDTRDRELRRQLYAAGLYQTTPRRFLGYRVLAAVALAGFWLWLMAVSGSGLAATIVGTLCLGASGWVGPMFLVKRRAATRLEQVDHEIPELVDLLVTAVEGGLGFAGALQLVAPSLEGPLGDEIRIVLQEHEMGLTTHEALRNMAGRIDTLSMRSFIQAVNQGELLGVSIAKIMRDLATEMRSRRRQSAEERAHKAGTKIVFPVALCIFPAIFVIALGPPLIYLTHNLGF